MYVRERAGYDVETDPYRGTFGQIAIPVASAATGRVQLGEVDVVDEVGAETTSTFDREWINPEADFVLEAEEKLGVKPISRESGYVIRYYGKNQEAMLRDRDLFASIGWLPAFEWSREYGEWWQIDVGGAKGTYYGLVYRESDMPSAYRPAPQPPDRGGGSIVRTAAETMVKNADGSFSKVPAGTLIRSCTKVIPGGPTVIVQHPVDVPCEAGTGGCPEDRPCTLPGEFIANLRSTMTRLLLPRFVPSLDKDGYKTGKTTSRWYKNKWVWIGAGAVVIAGGAGVYFMRRRRG